ncbi:NAD(P)H-dependent oxidoreductase [Thiothrix nivea]|uniref:NADPH-dependent FMN reductase n=1 Tax=Thiothrix nivea (strain ATCC 35100 / DSM 5205 / JP2) TaxID=870187 RepID=A0A656HE25_THINJ|nr:NAD(P)H-dependent oxidoreductase [Thiothrix nivea]EIJ34657.1 NADPH-dependent FMN reductase [Thiothrix nivea DSM 5205]
MKIMLISGSHRESSQSEKVARHIAQSLLDNQQATETEVFTLAGNPLPLWDEGIWNGDEQWQALLNPLSEKLATSDGFVIISPEWHGQVPAGLKNFFLLWGAGELAHKPALIVTVSSGDGGAYPVAELRMSSYKNNRLCYIPEHIIVRNVESVLNADTDKNNPDADNYFRQRIVYAGGILSAYAEALKVVRASGVTHTEMFRNGM